MTTTPKHARGLADAARRIFATHDLPTTLSTIAQAARDALAGIEEAAIALPGRDGQVRGMAATDPLALALEEMQHELAEGPSLDALGERRMVVVNHLPAQFRRWPRYAPRPPPWALRSQMCLPLAR